MLPEDVTLMTSLIRNYRKEAHVTAGKLMELHVNSWNFMYIKKEDLKTEKFIEWY